MSNNSILRCSRCNSPRGCCSCGCGFVMCSPGCTPNTPGGIAGPPGPAGPIGPAGPAGAPGATAATIPFAVSKNGVMLMADEQGEPRMVVFSGFSPTYYNSDYLMEGEWATGTITIRPEMQPGAMFVMPHNAVLQNIYVTFMVANGVLFEAGATVYPFACLAVSNADSLVFNILQNTMTFTAPYAGGVEYPGNAMRRGSLTNLNIPVAEGSLVGIVVGIMSENNTEAVSGMFRIAGGLYLE